LLALFDFYLLNLEIYNNLAVILVYYILLDQMSHHIFCRLRKMRFPRFAFDLFLVIILYKFCCHFFQIMVVLCCLFFLLSTESEGVLPHMFIRTGFEPCLANTFLSTMLMLRRRLHSELRRHRHHKAEDKDFSFAVARRIVLVIDVNVEKWTDNVIANATAVCHVATNN
jgi:hypothetical protein